MAENPAPALEARILLVDDDEQNAAGIVRVLAGAGYRVSHARYSLDGLREIEDSRPAVVILDWEMPFIDGRTFLRALHAGMDNPPPVLVLAAEAIDLDEIKRAGASGFIVGSPAPAQLLNAVQELLAQTRVAGCR